MTARRLRGVVLAGMFALSSRAAMGQVVSEPAGTPESRARWDRADAPGTTYSTALGESPADDHGVLRRSFDRLPVWSAPLASLVVPGAGQARLKQGRAIAYFAAETFILLRYRNDRNEGTRNERDFRALARTIARRDFVPNPPDTVWQYYEKLSEYLESGAFSMEANGPTVPETDPQTYNGFQWLLARQQYGIPATGTDVDSPQYARALALYESRAMRQPYRWSWRNAQLERDRYVQAISRTNDAYRRATLDLSALIANHLLSAIDAFAVVRLTPDVGGVMRVSTSLTIP